MPFLNFRDQLVLHRAHGRAGADDCHALPGRRHPHPERERTGDTSGQGACVGPAGRYGAGASLHLLARPVRAQLFDRRQVRRSELHRRQGSTAGAEPARF